MRRANEAGRIMVLMYHDISPNRSEWVRTPEQFERDLETLYEKGYRPISLRDLATGSIGTPAGYSPVVLTFDDGTQGQFNIFEGEGGLAVDPRSAVGIMEAFGKKHPDFPLEATFFLSGDRPFRQDNLVEHKLNYLVSAGMDIGNHTLGHHNLRLPRYGNPASIQRAIGGQSRFLTSRLSDHPDYSIDTFALCFGQRPEQAFLRPFLQRGRYAKRSYENVAVVNVGGGAAFSPFDRRFDPADIPRIRANDDVVKAKGFYEWLQYFDQNPALRFVSDGDEKRVTIPAQSRKMMGKAGIGGKTLKIAEYM